MLSSVIRATPRARLVSRNLAMLSKRPLSLGSAFQGKERVEESLYIKQQEEAWKEKLRALRAQEASQRKAEEHKVVVEPVMKDIADLLKASGDSVSDAGLEALAKWKLSL